MQKTPVLLTLCVKDTPSCELNLCVPHIWQTCLHNDKLEQKFFRMLIKVAWTKKGTIWCCYVFTCVDTSSWLSFPEKLDEQFRGGTYNL